MGKYRESQNYVDIKIFKQGTKVVLVHTRPSAWEAYLKTLKQKCHPAKRGLSAQEAHRIF